MKRFAATALCILFCGCGYTTRSAVKLDFSSIHVAPFENRIDITRDTDTGSNYRVYRPRLETDITRAVIEQFLWDGNLKPVDEGEAEVVLKGQLVEYRKDPLMYTDNDDVREYRLNIVVDVSLWDRKHESLLWEVKRFTGDTTYFVTGPQAKTESAAITDAITDLGRRIVERTVEQW